MSKKHQDTMFNSNTSISLGICVIAKTPLSTAIPLLRLIMKQILPGPCSSNLQMNRQTAQACAFQMCFPWCARSNMISVKNNKVNQGKKKRLSRKGKEAAKLRKGPIQNQTKKYLKEEKKKKKIEQRRIKSRLNDALAAHFCWFPNALYPSCPNQKRRQPLSNGLFFCSLLSIEIVCFQPLTKMCSPI